MLTEAKSKDFSDVFSEKSDNPRRLRNYTINIMHRIPPPALPEFLSRQLEIFVHNFQKKYRIFH